MPSPSSSLATLRPDLADSLTEFDLELNQQGFIGSEILPTLDVDRETGTFGKIPIEQLLQNATTTRAPGSGYNRGNFTFTTDSYACVEYGWEEPVDDREATIYQDYFDADMHAARRAKSFVVLEAEKRIAAAVFNATTFTSQTTAITNEWDDFTNAVPITDVNTAINAIYSRTGLWANTLVVNRKVFRNLRQCDQVMDVIAASGAGDPHKQSDVTVQMLAQVFDLQKILVAGGSKNSAKEGQSATPAQIWSDEYAMVCVTANSNDIREPCLGRIFHFGADGSTVDGTVEEYRDETVRSKIIRVRHDVDEKLLYTEAGQLFSNVTT